jgi:hypothetical protein
MNYTAALALDPEFRILDVFSTLSPKILMQNPYMFKANTGLDPDNPTIKDALTGPHCDEFIEGMAFEIE